MDETLYDGFNQLMLLKLTCFYILLGALLSKFRLDRSFCTCRHCLMRSQSLRCFLLICMLLLSHSSFVACHCLDFSIYGLDSFSFLPLFLPILIPLFPLYDLFLLWLSCSILSLNVHYYSVIIFFYTKCEWCWLEEDAPAIFATSTISY